MDKKQVVEDLSRLLREIDQVSLEEADRRKLHRMVGDIERHVEAPEEGPDKAELVSTAEELITRFETDHPALTGVMRRVMNALSSMGV